MGKRLKAVYKPTRGERPLWDFPAAYPGEARGSGILGKPGIGLGAGASNRLPPQRPSGRRLAAALHRA